MHWLFCTFHRALSACFELQQAHLNHLSRRITETESLCHIDDGISLRCSLRDTGSGFIIMLGACRLRRQTYRLPQRNVMHWASTASRVTSKRSIPAPNPG